MFKHGFTDEAVKPVAPIPVSGLTVNRCVVRADAQALRPLFNAWATTACHDSRVTAPVAAAPLLGPNDRRLPPVALLLSVGVAAHLFLWPYVGKDFADFLQPWFDHIVATGPVEAFATPFSDYAPPYLYLLAATTLLAPVASTFALVKLLSLFCAALLAGACHNLLRAAGARDAARGAALIAATPTVLLNVGLLAQCDSLYVAALVMAAAAAIKGRPATLLAWFGLAISIKAQAAFLGPFVLGWLLSNRVSPYLWLIGPAATLATLLPAALAGWPWSDLLTIYLRQAGEYPALALDAPNLWQIAQALPGFPASAAKGPTLLLAAAAGTMLAAAMSRSRLSPNATLPLALLSALLIPGLLPMMHERYFFAADIFALLLAIIRRDADSWKLAALVQFGSFAAVGAYVVGVPGFAALGAVAMIVATVRLARSLATVPAASGMAVA